MILNSTNQYLLKIQANESNLAMLWGSIKEDSTLLIYLKRFGGKNTDNLITR